MSLFENPSFPGDTADTLLHFSLALLPDLETRNGPRVLPQLSQKVKFLSALPQGRLPDVIERRGSPHLSTEPGVVHRCLPLSGVFILQIHQWGPFLPLTLQTFVCKRAPCRHNWTNYDEVVLEQDEADPA